jgi:hypothetical protein
MFFSRRRAESKSLSQADPDPAGALKAGRGLAFGGIGPASVNILTVPGLVSPVRTYYIIEMKRAAAKHLFQRRRVFSA